MVPEALEGPTLLLHTVPFDRLRERIVFGGKKVPSRRRTAILTKCRHPELDSGSVKHTATVATDPETSSG